jgi:hypothetical protein
VTIYKDDLMRVRQLIEKPENWTQKAYARDANGRPLDPEGEGDDIKYAKDEKATCWCLNGAGFKCGIDENALRDALGFDGDFSHDWNDTHTHAEVLSLLDSAIERAQERP